MEIGNVLSNWRAVEKLTLKGAAEKIGLPFQTLHRIEGGGQIDGRTLLKLVHFLFG